MEGASRSLLLQNTPRTHVCGDAAGLCTLGRLHLVPHPLGPLTLDRPNTLHSTLHTPRTHACQPPAAPAANITAGHLLSSGLVGELIRQPPQNSKWMPLPLSVVLGQRLSNDRLSQRPAKTHTASRHEGSADRGDGFAHGYAGMPATSQPPKTLLILCHCAGASQSSAGPRATAAPPGVWPSSAAAPASVTPATAASLPDATSVASAGMKEKPCLHLLETHTAHMHMHSAGTRGTYTPRQPHADTQGLGEG